MKKLILKYTLLYFIGGLLYYEIEILWRGRSHPAMAAVGGICFILCGLINEVFSWETPLLLQGVYGGALITAIELIAGLLLNVRLGLNIWDYSSIPCNFMGQICLPFSLLWIILAIVAVVFDDYLRYWLFDEEKPHYRII